MIFLVWILFAVLFGAIILLLLCYPFTLLLIMEQGKVRIYWLPRVFGGYSSPVLLEGKKQRPKSWAEIKKSLRRAKRVLCFVRLPRLENICFSFFLQQQLQGECIISYTWSDIIGKQIRHFWRKQRRLKYE